MRVRDHGLTSKMTMMNVRARALTFAPSTAIYTHMYIRNQILVLMMPMATFRSEFVYTILRYSRWGSMRAQAQTHLLQSTPICELAV